MINRGFKFMIVISTMLLTGCGEELSTTPSDVSVSEDSEYTSDSSYSSLVTSSKEYEVRRKTYTNSPYNYDFPDPAVIYDDNTNSYWAYGTGGKILQSFDLVNWSAKNNVFTVFPQWGSQDAGVWAPDIQKINGQYVYYYSLSRWGDDNPGIGFATAPRPNGPWTDKGELFRSLSIGVNNSIDPNVFTAQDGRVFMVWGSMRGNFIVELSRDGLRLIDGTPEIAADNLYHVAGLSTEIGWTVGTYEGSYVVYREGFYYLFLSTGTCCEGLNSTYKLVVSRSTSPTGPYVDAYGNDMRQSNVGTPVISSNTHFVGTGHNSVLTDAAGDTWIVYHAYPVEEANKRVLMMDKLLWDESGWPYIENGTPSYTEQTGPTYLAEI